MKHRVKIRQHVLLPAVVEHEVEFDTQEGICRYVEPGLVVSHQDQLSVDELLRATEAPTSDRGANELAFKALLDQGLLQPQLGETITVHGVKLPFRPDTWAALDPLGAPDSEVVPMPDRVGAWRRRRGRSKRGSRHPSEVG